VFLLSNRFRWVSCQLDSLRHCLPSSVRHRLNELPGSLDKTYERILLEIAKEKRDHVHRIFQCLLVSIRPLRIEEIVEIFATRTVAETIPVGWRPEDTEEFILSACSTLVTVVKVNDNKVIQFSHFTVKEYLTSARLTESGRVSYFHILLNPAHALLASACIGTLLQLDDQIDAMKINNFPLASYAARHWVDHAQFEDISSYIQDAMECLFDKDKPHFAAWMWLYNIDNPSSELTAHPKVPDAVPLYYAALCGFHDIAERVIAAYPQDVDAKGGRCRTPLHAASEMGHASLALLPLECGADVKSRGFHRHTPLHLSSHHGYADMVQLLIDWGADSNAENAGQETPLIVASNNGSLETAELLLEHGVDANKADSSGWTSLHVASLNGHTDVVKLLLDHGANVNAENDIRDTPLHIASSRGDIMVTEVLLEYGADVGARDTQGGTPLHDAAESGYPEVVQLLLDHGADVNAQDGDGWTALHLATDHGHVQVGKILLRRGGHWYIENNQGNTPLEIALESNHNKIVQLLLKRDW
jgi:ankyrin repeat protein